MLNPRPRRFDEFVDPGKVLATPAAVCMEATAALRAIGDDVLGMAGARSARSTEGESEGAFVSEYDDVVTGTAEIDLRFQCISGFSQIRQPFLTATRHSSPCSVSGWVEILVTKDSAVVGDREVVVVDLESTVGEGGDVKVNGGGRFLVAALIAEVSMTAVTYFFGAGTDVILSSSAGDLTLGGSWPRSIAMGPE